MGDFVPPFFLPPRQAQKLKKSPDKIGLRNAEISLTV